LVVVFLSLSLAAGAWAKGFPGTVVAFQWEKSPNDYFVLTLKPNGTVKTNTTIRFYTISGAFFSPGAPVGYPVTGNGYTWGPSGSQQLYFHLTGTFYDTFMDLTGSIAQEPATGEVLARYSLAGGAWGSMGIYGLTLLTAEQIKALPYPPL
jgi:hypothetical protein